MILNFRHVLSFLLTTNSHLQGMLCPVSHPFPCQGGRKCSNSAWKPASGSEADCDGTQLMPDSLCCPTDSIDCSTDANLTCKPNPTFGETWQFYVSFWDHVSQPYLGHLCPTSHPFTCADGSMCSRLKWKPTSGSDSDCDGTTLGKSSVCCPLFGTVPCNGDSRYKCLENPSMQG